MFEGNSEGRKDSAIPGKARNSLLPECWYPEQGVQSAAGKSDGVTLTSLRPCEILILKMQMRQILGRLEAAGQKICSDLWHLVARSLETVETTQSRVTRSGAADTLASLSSSAGAVSERWGENCREKAGPAPLQPFWSGGHTERGGEEAEGSPHGGLQLLPRGCSELCSATRTGLRERLELCQV